MRYTCLLLLLFPNINIAQNITADINPAALSATETFTVTVSADTTEQFQLAIFTKGEGAQTAVDFFSDGSAFPVTSLDLPGPLNNDPLQIKIVTVGTFVVKFGKIGELTLETASVVSKEILITSRASIQVVSNPAVPTTSEGVIIRVTLQETGALFRADGGVTSGLPPALTMEPVGPFVGFIVPEEPDYTWAVAQDRRTADITVHSRTPGEFLVTVESDIILLSAVKVVIVGFIPTLELAPLEGDTDLTNRGAVGVTFGAAVDGYAVAVIEATEEPAELGEACPVIPDASTIGKWVGCFGTPQGGTCAPTCQQGYEATTNSGAAPVATCTSGNQWEGVDDISCTIVECNVAELPLVVRGSWVSCSPQYRGTCTVECEETLSVVGPSSALCSADGTWALTSTPRCIDSHCENGQGCSDDSWCRPTLAQEAGSGKSFCTFQSANCAPYRLENESCHLPEDDSVQPCQKERCRYDLTCVDIDDNGPTCQSGCVVPGDEQDSWIAVGESEECCTCVGNGNLNCDCLTITEEYCALRNKVRMIHGSNFTECPCYFCGGSQAILDETRKMSVQGANPTDAIMGVWTILDAQVESGGYIERIGDNQLKIIADDENSIAEILANVLFIPDKRLEFGRVYFSAWLLAADTQNIMSEEQIIVRSPVTSLRTRSIPYDVPQLILPCVYGDWVWGECDDVCQGTQPATRETVEGDCPTDPEDPSYHNSRPCNSDVQCIECKVTEWAPWSTCSRTGCATGEQRRQRSVVLLPFGNRLSCPATVEDEECAMPVEKEHCPTCTGEWIYSVPCPAKGNCDLANPPNGTQQWRCTQQSCFCESIADREVACDCECQVTHWSAWSSCKLGNTTEFVQNGSRGKTAAVQGESNDATEPGSADADDTDVDGADTDDPVDEPADNPSIIYDDPPVDDSGLADRVCHGQQVRVRDIDLPSTGLNCHPPELEETAACTRSCLQDACELVEHWKIIEHCPLAGCDESTRQVERRDCILADNCRCVAPIRRVLCDCQCSYGTFSEWSHCEVQSTGLCHGGSIEGTKKRSQTLVEAVSPNCPAIHTEISDCSASCSLDLEVEITPLYQLLDGDVAYTDIVFTNNANYTIQITELEVNSLPTASELELIFSLTTADDEVEPIDDVPDNTTIHALTDDTQLLTLPFLVPPGELMNPLGAVRISRGNLESLLSSKTVASFPIQVTCLVSGFPAPITVTTMAHIFPFPSISFPSIVNWDTGVTGRAILDGHPAALDLPTILWSITPTPPTAVLTSLDGVYFTAQANTLRTGTPYQTLTMAVVYGVDSTVRTVQHEFQVNYGPSDTGASVSVSPDAGTGGDLVTVTVGGWTPSTTGDDAILEYAIFIKQPRRVIDDEAGGSRVDEGQWEQLTEYSTSTTREIVVPVTAMGVIEAQLMGRVRDAYGYEAQCSRAGCIATLEVTQIGSPHVFVTALPPTAPITVTTVLQLAASVQSIAFTSLQQASSVVDNVFEAIASTLQVMNSDQQYTFVSQIIHQLIIFLDTHKTVQLVELAVDFIEKIAVVSTQTVKQAILEAALALLNSLLVHVDIKGGITVQHTKAVTLQTAIQSQFASTYAALREKAFDAVTFGQSFEIGDACVGMRTIWTSKNRLTTIHNIAGLPVLSIPNLSSILDVLPNNVYMQITRWSNDCDLRLGNTDGETIELMFFSAVDLSALEYTVSNDVRAPSAIFSEFEAGDSVVSCSINGIIKNAPVTSSECAVVRPGSVTAKKGVPSSPVIPSSVGNGGNPAAVQPSSSPADPTGGQGSVPSTTSPIDRNVLTPGSSTGTTAPGTPGTPGSQLDDSEGGGSNTGLLIAAVIGGCVGICCVGGILAYCLLTRTGKKAPEVGNKFAQHPDDTFNTFGNPYDTADDDDYGDEEEEYESNEENGMRSSYPSPGSGHISYPTPFEKGGVGGYQSVGSKKQYFDEENPSPTSSGSPEPQGPPPTPIDELQVQGYKSRPASPLSFMGIQQSPLTSARKNRNKRKRNRKANKGYDMASASPISVPMDYPSADEEFTPLKSSMMDSTMSESPLTSPQVHRPTTQRFAGKTPPNTLLNDKFQSSPYQRLGTDKDSIGDSPPLDIVNSPAHHYHPTKSPGSAKKRRASIVVTDDNPGTLPISTPQKSVLKPISRTPNQVRSKPGLITIQEEPESSFEEDESDEEFL